MKLYEYCYRNRKLNCGSQPLFNNIDKEHATEGLKRELLSLTDETKKRNMADLELVYIGTFDDVTLKHEQLDNPELLLTCSDYIQINVEAPKAEA